MIRKTILMLSAMGCISLAMDAMALKTPAKRVERIKYEPARVLPDGRDHEGKYTLDGASIDIDGERDRVEIISSNQPALFFDTTRTEDLPLNPDGQGIE